MAEASLKLGGGNWATKEDSILGYNDENGNYKPIPFDFSRASIGTRVNRDGLIEVVQDNIPRIDFSNGEGSLLLEPQRTNLVVNSEYFNGSSWTLDNVVITDNATTSPEGIDNASKWAAASGFSSKIIYEISTCTNGVPYTASAYFKADNYSYAFIRLGAITGNPYVIYDLSDQSVVSTSALTSHNIESVGNGWYRITATATTTTTLIAPNLCFLPSSGYTLNANNIPEYTGDGTSGGFIWGAQVEEGSYPTSYIPTSGSAVTRVADGCSKTSATDLIGQTEGTLFFDVNISRVVGNEAIGTINSGAYANHATIQRVGSTIQFVRNSATQSGATIVTSATITAGRYKLAIAYKSGDTACFLNGAQVSTTQTQTFTNATLNTIKIGTDAIGALQISDSVKQSILFKTRLSNAELAELTTL